MIKGLMALGGLCLFELLLLKLAVKDDKKEKMDFYDFFDLEKPKKEKEQQTDQEKGQVKKVQLRVIKGGKAM